MALPAAAQSLSRADLVAAVRKHLAAEADYLDRVRECVLHWPAGAVAAEEGTAISAQLDALSRELDDLKYGREALQQALRLGLRAAHVRRISEFPWTEEEQGELAGMLHAVWAGASRLAGAVRASERSLGAWAMTVNRLIETLTGTRPHEGTYSASGRKVDASPNALLKRAS